MPYAIKPNGSLRAVSEDMELFDGEVLYDDIPQWAYEIIQTTPIENAWRTTELTVIARQLEAIEEDEADETPVDLLSGTKRQWLKYRGLVSNWKEGAESFPDITHRPVRPS